MSGFIKKLVLFPFTLIKYLLSIPVNLLQWIGRTGKNLFNQFVSLLKKIILLPFKIIQWILLLPLKPFRWLFGKKRPVASPAWHDVTSDPSMTRWHERLCANCGNITMHKISRNYQGAREASVRCTGCGHYEDELW